MGVLSDLPIRRLRERLDRLWGIAHVPEDPPYDIPGPDELDRAVAAAASRRRAAGDDLALSLFAISRRGDADLVEHTTRALIAANPRTWLVLDEAARRSWWQPVRWTVAVAHRLVSGRPAPLDLLLAACHSDGFVREAAVAAIAERDDVVLLPALALRAADWVPEVRDRARQACRRYLDHRPSEAITVLAPVAFALRTRQEGGWLAAALDDLLRDGPPEALDTALAAEDRRTRRAAHAIGIDAGRLGVDRLSRAATTDRDLPVRVMCAEAALRAARAVGDRDVPRRLLACGTAAVRAEAVRALGGAGEVDPATSALSDRSALVRATAQSIVRRAGTDPATRYRELLAAHQPPDPSVIAGLGETGTRTDTDLLLPWLEHPASRGRAEAVRALRRHGRTSPDLLLPLLTDPVSSVTRQVTLSLRGHADSLDEHFLWSLLDQAQPQHIRTAASRLLREHDTWTRISVDLRLFDDPAPALRADARADLTRWLTCGAAVTYSFPRGSRADELAALLTGTEAALGPERARLLRFHLGLTG